MREFDKQVRDGLKARVSALEEHFEGDVAYFYGPIFPSVEKHFRDFIEELKKDGDPQGRLVLFLNKNKTGTDIF